MELARPTLADPKEARFLTEDEYQHEKIGNREYITESKYILNTDEEDIKRLDKMQHLVRTMFGKNILAPIKPEKVRSILEVGYGSGAWAIEVARELPEARLFGFDVRTNPLPFSQIPPNLIFQRCDLSKGLPYMSKSFDYIHQRLLCLAATYEQWPGVFEDYYRVLRPGGWLEMLEFSNGWVNAGPISERLLGLLSDMAKKRGVDISTVSEWEPLLKKAGFTKITKNPTTRWCMGSWGGDIGVGCLEQSSVILAMLEPLLVQFGMVQPGEIQPLLDQWEEECNRLKTYQILYIYTAKKAS
jgi:ubiquinone/menaquinone biosynthesis C-methylase UbiE